MAAEIEIKICGLTRPDDARLAATSGATWLGVVFASGPRVVSAEQARAIVSAAARPVLGVFGPQSPDEILRLRDAAGLAGAQLHGAYDAADAARLRAEGLVVWRVVRLAGEEDLDRVAEAACEADAVLVEPRVAHADGGAGIALALPLALRARGRLAGARMVLAGGLTPETVGSAVGLVTPDVVDVSSGVEIRPGIKDPSKMHRFVEAVRAYRPPA
ncbi:MAG TPA: phosphoribosylanthranilate isomerase [Gemmatimonadales bacterium]|nr:phosphoribosylanthranilate isomerase [Gemmatimonadales bacterium]